MTVMPESGRVLDIDGLLQAEGQPKPLAPWRHGGQGVCRSVLGCNLGLNKMFHIVALAAKSPRKVVILRLEAITTPGEHRREPPIGEHARKPSLTASLDDRATGFSLIAALCVSD